MELRHILGCSSENNSIIGCRAVRPRGQKAPRAASHRALPLGPRPWQPRGKTFRRRAPSPKFTDWSLAVWPRLTNRTDAAAAAAVALAVEVVRRAASKPCSGPKERQGQPPRPASVCCVPTVLSQELTAHMRRCSARWRRSRWRMRLKRAPSRDRRRRRPR